MFRGMAPKGHSFPYITFHIISMTPEEALYEKATPYELCRVQFSVFDDSASSVAVEAILDEVETAYGLNGSGLTFADSTYTHIVSRRDLNTITRSTDTGVWMATVDYLMVIKTT